MTMLGLKAFILGLGASSSLIALTAAAQTAPPADQESVSVVDEIVVLGSRIPRQIDTEGPAPVTTIDSEEILRNGYQSVPDLLRAVTQNGGETQSQQSFSGASFTPGAQQVDLRGLGPNHTLVLVNGRRIADFPLPFQGQSNFTDVSNIPVGMIGRVGGVGGGWGRGRSGARSRSGRVHPAMMVSLCVLWSGVSSFCRSVWKFCCFLVCRLVRFAGTLP